MKSTRLVALVMMVAICAIGWFMLIGGVMSSAKEQNDLMAQAAEKRALGLHELAIASYEQAAANSASKEVYDAMIAAGEEWYAADHTSNVRKALVAIYDAATAAYPREAAYWEQYTQMYIDDGDFKKANAVLALAEGNHAESDRLTEQLRSVYYTYRTLSGRYAGIADSSAEGVFQVQTGDGWGVVDNQGAAVMEPVYTYVGPAGEDGWVLVVTADGETRLLDADGVMQARYADQAVQAYGYGDGLVPVLFKGRSDWCYMDTKGNEVFGGFKQAGMFQSGKAAVQQADGSWCLINTDGEQASEGSWEAVKLNTQGAYKQEGRVLLKTSGRWQVYNGSGKVQGEFACSDIDVSMGGAIAFAEGGKWGFVSRSGEVVIQPTYEAARSYAAGVAAVCQNGKWGFIDEDGVLVMEPVFDWVGFFDEKSSVCPVQIDGEHRFIIWNVAH